MTMLELRILFVVGLIFVTMAVLTAAATVSTLGRWGRTRSLTRRPADATPVANATSPARGRRAA
jgi:hypothetical protein